VNAVGGVWVNGKSQSGWYLAKQLWDAVYAKHLESLGFEVKQSTVNPESVPAAVVAIDGGAQ
jgi:hypothetical protein